MQLLIRFLAVIAGIAILGATAHVNIVAHGGYGEAYSFVIMAVALGVVIGSLAAGQAASEGRMKLAIWIAVAIIAGEAFSFVATAERLIMSRDAAQRPLIANQESRERARARIEAAERALAALPNTTDRIEAAEAAKTAADQAVIERSAERNCASNCRALLQAQVDAAQAELNAARAELAAMRAAAERELYEARKSLDSVPSLASATPLADRIGVPAWFLDLFQSALGSMAANGLACALLIFGAHRKRVQTVVEASAVEPVRIQQTKRQPVPEKRKVSARDHAAHFGIECLLPGGEAELAEIRRRYRLWCASRSENPLSDREIGAALADLFEATGIMVEERNGVLVALGVSLSEPQRKALGHMARSIAPGERI